MTIRSAHLTLCGGWGEQPRQSPEDTMTDAYSLTVHNNSELNQPTFAVFAQLPATSAYETLSLAWFTQQIDQGSTYTFSWQIQWGFAWAATGTDTGGQWAASGNLPADPNSASLCKAELDYDGAFTMTAVPGTPDGEHLWVVDSARVPLPSTNPSSVAVTLSGNSACVTNAGPNLFQTYTLHPTYFIDAGNYVQGQMVDGSSVSAFEELAYTGGNQALTVTLNEDNTWTTQSTSAVDVTSLFTGVSLGNGE